MEEYEIKKRRYLNRSRIAFCDQEIMSRFVRRLTQLEKPNEQDFSLRKSISKLFHLTENMAFRHNATQTFRDVLEGLVYHKKETTNQYANYKLLVTDIDHPVMTQMAGTILPSEFICKGSLVEKVILNNHAETKEIVEFFLQEIDLHQIKMVLIPHVNWINGAKFDVVGICKAIKDYDSELVTIVDGAQALANTETVIDRNNRCNEDIDFYVGSGQKWMGSPMPIGFVRVSKKYLEIKSFRDFLFISDYFSGFAGNLDYLDQLAQDTYNIPLSILFDSVIREFQDGNNMMQDHYYGSVMSNLAPIREIVDGKRQLGFFDPNNEMRSGMLAMKGKLHDLSRIHQSLLKSHFANTKGMFEFQEEKFPFIRISSPLDRLNENDLKAFDHCLR